MKLLAGDYVNVRVKFASSLQRPIADSMIATFALANWKTDLVTTPMERLDPTKQFRGVRITGHNKVLVETVKASLRKIGFTNLSSDVVDIGQPGREDLKWKQIRARVEILIGR